MTGLFQLFFRENPETDGVAFLRLGAALDDQTVVAHLFQPAEVEGVGVVVADDQAHDLFVKGPARLQIA